MVMYKWSINLRQLLFAVPLSEQAFSGAISLLFGVFAVLLKIEKKSEIACSVQIL